MSYQLIPRRSRRGVSQLFTSCVLSVTPSSMRMGIAPVRKNRKCMYPVALPTCRTTRGNFRGTFKGGPLTIHQNKDVPVVSAFRRMLNVGAILVNFKLRSGTVRSPGRGVPLSVFHGKVRTIIRFCLGCGWGGGVEVGSFRVRTVNLVSNASLSKLSMYYYAFQRRTKG